MALMTARRLVVRGRPPGRAAGSSGATSAQASSVKSVSYNSSVFSTDPFYTDSGKLFKHPLSATSWSIRWVYLYRQPGGARRHVGSAENAEAANVWSRWYRTTPRAYYPMQYSPISK